MSVSGRLRYEVFRRDDFACRYCGSRAPDVQLTVDHVVPVALGGEDKASNLVTACAACNAGKSSSSPDQPIVEGVSDDALRWARAIREAAALQDERREVLEMYRSVFLEQWEQWTTGHDKQSIPLPVDWPDTLEKFYHAGVDVMVMCDFVDKAGRSAASPAKMFRYFCGCCWNHIREQQGIARALLVREEANGEA